MRSAAARGVCLLVRLLLRLLARLLVCLLVHLQHNSCVARLRRPTWLQ